MKVMIANIKLPKQWANWCADSGLRFNGGEFYLKGKGRHWRVNCYAEFECGDTYEEFDRWALSRIEYAPIPQSRAEFRQTVKDLIARISVPETEEESE